MASYPARFERYSEDEILVTFRDLPECMTAGVDEPEAWAEALDALEEAIVGRIDEGDDIPMPSALQAGERYVPIDLVEALALWRSLGCSLCRRVSTDDEFERFLADGTRPEAPDECDHPIMQNRDAVEARYARIIRHIEDGDADRDQDGHGSHELPAAAASVITARR